MTTASVFSPNEPDIAPDYVDDPARTAAPRAARRADDSHREGECVPNVPDAAPNFLGPEEEQAVNQKLSAEAAARAAEEARVFEAAAEIAEDGGTAESGPSAARTPSWWKWHAAATVLIAGLLGALLFSQAISAAALAATLPAWAQYALLIPFGLCCLAVLWVCAGLLRAWRRLRAVRQVDMGALEELRLRAKSRRNGVEQYRAARGQIEDYLKKYPLAAESRTRLLAAGLSPAQTDALAAARDFLVGRAQDSRTWLTEYRDHYQATLDKAAATRVTAWSLKAAGCVIASPLPLLDALLVLGIALKLVKDLSVMYNVRTGRVGTLLILRRAVAAAFIAGIAEEATEAAGVLAGEHLAGLAGAKIAGVVAPKLGEGVVNALFIRHVGRATISLLQPIKPEKKGK